ncbi:MAG: hypothetical protein DMG91_07745 [Acidobacteria bacterium]|nr:MAG: hypothetical protein DMG91_07745 [Acidobacteriota bacterium]
MKGPVFIVGCPRSGTSFLYHLMLSAGGFAEFRTQMNVYDVLEPIYGDLRVLANRRRMMKDWLQSKAFAVSGLVHIIRDPRDVALSLDKRGWTRPLPWDKQNSLPAAGVYWKWIVSKARADGKLLGDAYNEVRYETLVNNPHQSLKELGKFLDHDLDYDRIQQVSIGSVKNPLTSFSEDLQSGTFMPIGRWKEKFPAEKLALFEALIGDYMGELGYPPSKAGTVSKLRATGTRLTYGAFYEFKQWAKINTPMSRWMLNYSDILIDK